MSYESAEQDIEVALFSRASELKDLLGLPISWANRPFTRPTSGAYLRVQLFRNQNRPFTDDDTLHMGFLQVTVVARVGEGLDDASVLARRVAEYFPKDLILTEGDTRIKVSKKPDVMTALQGEASWDVPVSVYYEAFA